MSMVSPRGVRRQFLTTVAAGSACWIDPVRTVQGLAAVEDSLPAAGGQRGVAATVHPLATRAALECFERGGNAIDAAVAASLMLGVVDGYNSGLGGGGLALLRLADGRLIALDGRETAPRQAKPELYVNAQGQLDPQLSQEGPLAVAVPGLPALLERLSADHGRLDWQPSLLEAAEVADRGFELSARYARVLRAAADRLRRFPASAAILLDAGGQAWPAGHSLRQPDLARSLRALADQGSDWFYRGEFAERLDQLMRAGGGPMRLDDLADYRVLDRQPIVTDYRGHRVVGFPPPSSGGIHVAQMLGMLKSFDMAELLAGAPATGYHILLEVMKRAMADRAHWLGDADFAQVPRGLIDADYLRQRAEGIDPQRATAVTSHGVPPRADVDLFGPGGHTTHLTTADADGNVVALTQTINTSFGAKLIVPGTGILLNNEMDDFSLGAGVRNAFGLVGSAANAIVGCKRPLSSMSPSIVLDDQGAASFSCGAAGGPRIITAVLQLLVRRLDLGQSPHELLTAPRVHHQWSPDRAVVENGLPESIIAELRRMGHQVQSVDNLAVAQAVGRQAGGWAAAADVSRL